MQNGQRLATQPSAAHRHFRISPGVHAVRRLPRIMIASAADDFKRRSGIGVRILGVFEQMFEEPLWRVEKVSRDEEVLRLAIGNLLDGATVEAEQNRAWIAQDDRRVGRDEELRVPWAGEIVDDLEGVGISHGDNNLQESRLGK
jgi:hypothetical protein